ncbi:MAG: hypothetical protein E7256_05950 [Lachnospiraceae bacterium]|nr:hypothetical protein [Lachnospiraceae bacterium]
MDNLISREELIQYIDELENAIDKFIVAGIFYGLNSGNDHTEGFLTIKKEQVDLDQGTITLEDGRCVIMDELLKKVTSEAMEQTTYCKIGGVNTATSDEEYELNPYSPYIIKVKPLAKNGDGMMPLSNAGFKRRIRMISEFLTGDTSLTPTTIKFSGAYDLFLRQERKISYTEAENILKENGLIIRRNHLVVMLKMING